MTERFLAERGEDEVFDPTSPSLKFLCDPTCCGGHKLFDSPAIDEGRPPYLTHFCNHNPVFLGPPPEHWPFDKRRWKEWANSIPASAHGFHAGETHLQFLRRIYDPVFNNQTKIPNVNSLEDMLDLCEKRKIVLVSSGFLEWHYANGPNYEHLQHAPHLDNRRPVDSLYVYAGIFFNDRAIGHKTKNDRAHKYGWGRQYGAKARALLIEGRFKFLMSRVGLTHNSDTPDLGSGLIPLPIDTIIDVEWNGPGIHNANYTTIYTNYDWV